MIGSAEGDLARTRPPQADGGPITCDPAGRHLYAPSGDMIDSAEGVAPEADGGPITTTRVRGRHLYE